MASTSQRPDGILEAGNPSPKTILITLWSLLEGRRASLIWLGLLVAAETILVLGGAGLLRRSVDQTGHQHLLLTGALLAAVLTTGISLVGAATSWLGTRVGERITSQARRELLSRLLALPQEKLERDETAALLSRLNQDLPWASHAFLQIYRSLLADGPVVVLVLGYLFTLSWRLTLTAMLAAPPLVWWSVWTARRMARLARNYSDELAARSSLQQDILSRAALIKSAGAMETVLNRYGRIEDRVLELSLHLNRRAALADPVGLLLAVAALATVAILGSSWVREGSLTQGTYLAFLAGLGVLVMLTRRISARLAGMGRAFGALTRVLSFHQSLPPPSTQKRELDIAGPELAFESVTFRYGDRAAILEDFHLDVPAGRITMVAGPSGVGKSTALKLGAGLYQPTKGRVILGGRDLREITTRQRAEWIAWLGQEAFLLDDSIEFNLTMGRDIPRKRLVDILTRVGLADLISRMTASVEDRVGEDGRRLSAGQRRRLALARCVLSPAKILLLDEPTESLDDETARLVADLLVAEARTGRTLLVATHDHRISSIADLWMDMGRKDKN